MAGRGYRAQDRSRTRITRSALAALALAVALPLLAGNALASGGPDGFGYAWRATADAGGPAYNFTDIGATGTNLGLGNDAVATVSLGFGFVFYGTTYTQVNVSSNGFLSFSVLANSFPTAQALPNGASPNNVVAGWWANLDPSASGGKVLTQVQGSAPSRVFIAQWHNVPHSGSSPRATFQIKLFETSNVIEVQLKAPGTDGSSHSSGIENAAGTTGLSYLTTTAAGPATTAVRYSPAVGATTASLSGTLGDNSWYRSSVTVMLACAPPNPPSGASCVSTTYSLDGGATQTYAGPFEVSSEGAHSVSFFSTASTGGVEATKTTSFKVDATNPSAGSSATCSFDGNNGWCRGSVDVGGSGSDATSGLATLACEVDGGNVDCAGATVSSEGAHAFTATATDNAGNSAASSASFQIDTAAPTITLASRTPANTFGWNNSPVDVSWSCSDATSGPLAPGADATLTDEGSDQSASGTCEDAAGNTASATEDSIDIDLTPPSLAGSRSPAANAFGWNNEDVTVSFVCADALSGVDASSADTTLASEGAGQSVEGACADHAGNTATATVGDISIDKTAPSLTGSRNPAANADGWNNEDVTVSFVCADALSGVDTSSPDTTLTTEGAGQSVEGACADHAGNTATATVGDINIDKTAPSVAATPSCATAGTNGWCRDAVSFAVSASDSLSGLASGALTCTLDGAAADCGTLGSGADGAHTARASATDLAGNAAEATADFRVDATAPTGSVTAPPAAVTTYQVIWTASDATSGVAHVEVQERPLFGLLGDEFATVCAYDLANLRDASGACERDTLPGGYCYRVVVRDAAGNEFVSLHAGLDDADPAHLLGDLTSLCTLRLAPSLPIPPGSLALVASAPAAPAAHPDSLVAVLEPAAGGTLLSEAGVAPVAATVP